ncbi:MAG: MBL fold metallo-hydrolase [Clostridia bacterium]|nr:MBL fold metallo-hydrolase [Clostridia bacterium]
MYERRSIGDGEPWLGAMDPFKISDNIYFVGSFQESCHIIDTGEGLILIDSGSIYTFYMVIDNIYRAGLDPRDIKYAVYTHYHSDHTGSVNQLKHLTGCKVIISKADEKNAFEESGLVADITVEDGDTLKLGNTELKFIYTPGHTIGVMSVIFNTTVDGVPYRAGMFGGAGPNSLKKRHRSYYPECLNDYINSCDRLLKEKVDIFIGNHCWNNDTFTKAKILRETGENRFIDPGEWVKFLEFCKTRAKNVNPDE